MKIIRGIKNKYFALPVQVRASFWFLLCSVIQKGISIITTPIFTRLLTTEEYGQYNVFNSWLTIITVFVTLRMYNAVYTQGLIKLDTSKEKREFSSSLQGLTLVLLIAWVTFYICTHQVWNSITGFTTVQMLFMFGLIWTTAVFSFWAGEQRVLLKYRALVLISLAVSILKPVFSIVLIYISYDNVTARILGIFLAELIGYSTLFFVQMIRGKKFFSKRFWKYSFFFCLPLVPHYLSQTLLNSADKIMIERMIGDSEAGIYSLAYSLSQLMLMVNQALIQTINPWIYQKIKEKKATEIQKVGFPCLAIVGIMNIILICFAPEIVMFFAPESYYNAIWIIPPVALSGYFTFAYSLFADFEFYYEKKKYIAIATALSAVLNILLNFIFINLFGYYAAGYTTLVCYMIYTLGHYIFMKKLIRKYLDGVEVYNQKKLLLMTTVFFAVSIIMLFTYRLMIFRYSVIAVIFIILFIKRKKIIEIIKRIMYSRSRPEKKNVIKAAKQDKNNQ